MTAIASSRGFRWHKGAKGEAIGSLLLGLYDDGGELAARRRVRELHDGEAARARDVSRAVSRERARGSSVARVGGGRSRSRRTPHRNRAAAVDGVRARTCRGSRCDRSSSFRWRTITCRARAFGTPRSFVGGERTRIRAIARSSNSKSSRRRRSPRSSLRGARDVLRIETVGGEFTGEGREGREERLSTPPPRQSFAAFAAFGGLRGTISLSDLAHHRRHGGTRNHPLFFFARDGATRVPSSFVLRKCGGHGASPSPEASSRAARSSS